MPVKATSKTTKKTRITKKKVIVPTILSLEDSVKKAIKTIKECPYKGTHVKVELEGQMNRDRISWTNERCDEFLREHVSQEARDSLVYGRFYVDGSVDSEYTFTLPLEKVAYVIEFIEAFKELSESASASRTNKLIVNGAGMHIAILNNPIGLYPDGNRYDKVYAQNFTYSMNKLLPALFFLGTGNAKSRPLSYRAPKVDMRDKYSAITGYMGVFEYRVFETCYDKPQAFLDFFCVVAKSLQFFGADKIELPFFGQIGKLVIPDNGYHLSRFYYTANHLKALDLGLAILKPDHKTIEQLKKERNFNISEKKLAKEDAELEIELSGEYEQKKKDFAKKVEEKKKQLSVWYDQEKAVVPELISYSKEEMIDIEIAKMLRENTNLTDKKQYVDSKKTEKLNTGRLYTVTV